MTTLLFSHPACLEHDMGAGHPERPDRLRAIMQALNTAEFDSLERREAPAASEEQIGRVHPATYIAMMRAAAPKSGIVMLDPDTAMSPGTLEAAFRAAGAACAAVDAVVAGEANNAFCAIRPPGHHAEPEHAMGFCFFNNIAIAAQQARAVHGLKRVVVVDFDVHHGNGTQAAFEKDEDLLFVSSHQSPLYPGTGRADERGVGNILNQELSPGAASDEFRRTWERHGLPAVDDFAPEMILISAGFDAHSGDPLAQLNLEADDYGWITSELAALAAVHTGGRIVSTLEGGYELKALAASAAAHVRALMAA